METDWLYSNLLIIIIFATFTVSVRNIVLTVILFCIIRYGHDFILF